MDHPLQRLALAAAALLLTAGGAAAQACLGLPTRDGEIALAAAGGRADGDTRYGAELAADVSGPTAFGFAYDGIGDDGDRQHFTGRLAYDFFLVEPEVCAVAGVLFDTAPTAGIEDRLGFPVGLGLGKTVAGPGFSTTVFAVPQYVWVREERERAPSGGAGRETVSSSEFMAEAGVTLRFLTFYVGGSLVATSFEESDPGFRIRAGLVF